MSPIVVLLTVAAFGAGTFFLFREDEHKKAPFNPLKEYAPCTVFVQGPTQQYICAHNIVWTHQDGRWVGGWLATPRIPVPLG